MWAETNGASAYDGRVVFGEPYGLAESESRLPRQTSKIPHCRVAVTYVAPCGHEMTNTSCAAAFDYASSASESPECTQKVGFACPFCMENVESFCWVKEFFTSWQLWGADELPYKNASGDVCIRESMLVNTVLSNIPPKISKILPHLCKGLVLVYRNCHEDHSAMVKCTQLIDILSKKNSLKLCKEPVSRQLRCKHFKQTECHKKTFQPEPVW